MTNQSENTKRIAKNTLMLYIRMLFGMLVSLYTSRVVLQALGVEDYGIYNVVGGFVSMFSLISGSLSASTSRFLTFELGKGGKNIKEIFSTALSIHTTLIIIILVLSETVGLWLLNEKIVIPNERYIAANWAYQASLLSFFIRILCVPYNSLIIAHEKMKAFAYIGIIDIVIKFIIALYIALSPFSTDKLISYSCLLTMESILLQFIYILYCHNNFTECSLKLRFNNGYWKEMYSFAVWGFIGNMASILSSQGINILLNIFFGPVLNAARGIATTVNNTVVSFIGNFTTALNPQITKSYANQNYDYMVNLVETGAKFSYYIILLLALPIIFETEFILDIWLKNYPLHTVNFVRLALILSMCETFTTNTLTTLQLATGKIRTYQLVVGGTLFLNFPISYLVLKIGVPPEYVYIVAIAISLICMNLRLNFIKKQAPLKTGQYFKNVCCKIIFVTIISAVPPIFVYNIMSIGIGRFFTITGLCTLTTLISIYYIGCSKKERIFIIKEITSIRNKLNIKHSNV